MRASVRRPVTSVVRDARGLLCTTCGAVVPAAIRMGQTHGFILLCPVCADGVTRRLRFLKTTTTTTEG